MKRVTVDATTIWRLADSLKKLLPRRPRKECSYCCENKLEKHFETKRLPHGCRSHLSSVCRNCLRSTLEAQLGFRALLEVGCPSCRTPWAGMTLRNLLGMKGKKRFKELDILAKQQSLIPSDLPEDATLETMLQRGTRFCPWCRFPFVKEGGCDSIICGMCDKSFNISYALVLEDESGRRAAPIRDDFDAEDDWAN